MAKKFGFRLMFTVFSYFMLSMSLAYSASNPKIEKFNNLHNRIEMRKYLPEGIECKKDLSVLWSLMDQIVVGYLNAGNDVNTLPKVLSSMTGYREQGTSQKDVIGGAAFLSEPDQYMPTYSVTSVGPQGSPYLIGLYTFINERAPYAFYPGRVTLYTQRNGSWSRTDAFDGDLPILMYSFPDALSRGYFVSNEWIQAADRRDGYVKTWLVDRGKLIPQGHNYKELVDFSVEAYSASLTISYARVPRNLCEPVNGERLVSEIVFQLNEQGKMITKTRSLTPWLKVLDECIKPIRDNLKKARHCTKDKQTLNELHKIFRKNDCPGITGQSGDIGKGVAYVETNSDSEDRVLHISFERKNSRWYISSVTEKDRNE